ncbi:hypothetical protein HY945_05610 [Candidatus Gottesmanbacteria bacterium]|nr:hypothetical protein [Candidatus Gottesmanbacteria bacterium]
MNKLRTFLYEKYGKVITKELLSEENRIMADKLKKGGEGQSATNAQMEKFVEEGLLREDDYKKINRWSFDFPAWIGEFEPKEVMIVGLEPHIQENDYQTVYEFGETSNKSIQADHFLWKRLCFLFSEEKEFSEEKKLDTKILQKFYITDLCHFAPKGNANKIKVLKNWKNIRKNVADKFLIQEIELVQPKIILAQGGDAFKFLKKELELIDRKVECIETDYKNPKEYGIYFATYNDIKVFGVPHIGTEFNLLYNFWERKISVVREKIELCMSEKMG